MQQIAQELIALKKRREAIDLLYQAKLGEMDNALTLAARNTFEYDGYRFEKTHEAPVLALTQERLFAAMADAGLCETVQQQIFSAMSREAVQVPGVQVMPIVPCHRCAEVDISTCDLIIQC
jgi:hypothetical protein